MIVNFLYLLWRNICHEITQLNIYMLKTLLTLSAFTFKIKTMTHTQSSKNKQNIWKTFPKNLLFYDK